MAVLELDVGNTRLKWRVRDGCASGAIVRLGRSDIEVIAELRGAVAEFSFEQVIAASVTGDDFLKSLTKFFADAGFPSVEWACVTPVASGVECGYGDVSRLGVDRWLAVLAAHHREAEGAVVVDCGSAITVDVVRDGSHMGGYIVPGLRLMVDALFQGTDRVKVVREFDGCLAPGEDTFEAVNRGVVQMVVGLIGRSLEQWLREGDRGAVPLLLTGGDAALLAPVLKSELKGVEVVVCSELVMDGLRYCETREYCS